MKPPTYKRNLSNQVINFFWTILAFIPVIIFWTNEGLNWYFYISLGASFILGFLPEKTINLFRLSSNRRFYERIGVKFIRKFVQNGDIAIALAGDQKTSIINNISQARQYLKTIAMYERFHWICFCFFSLTAILSFIIGEIGMGLLIMAANLLYNFTSISLQQYNKIRINKIISITENKISR